MLRLAAALPFTLGAIEASPAQALQGPYTSVTIGGEPMHCAYEDGRRVPIYADTELLDIGIATKGGDNRHIVLNPQLLAKFSPIVQIWWFAHECGHTILGPQHTEADADCYAANAMRRTGVLIHTDQLVNFAFELSALPATPTHLPGPARVKTIAHCAFG